MTAQPTIRSAKEFAAVYRQGRSRAGHLISVHVRRRQDSGVSRIGVNVSKKLGGAVVRNKLRRRIKESLGKIEIPEGLDVVVGARSAARLATYQELENELHRTLRDMVVNGN